MKIIEGVLKFNGFEVEEIHFKINQIENNKRYVLNPEISKNIEIKEKRAKVSLQIIIGDESGVEYPIYLKAKITGHFETDEWPDEKATEMLLNQNAIAILFPYLRSLITTVTASCNISPIILPTMNIAQMLESEAKKAKTTS